MLAASFDVRVLGPVEVVKAGEPDVAVAVGKPMQRTLLGLLALRPGRVVSQTALVDALWDQCPPRSALKTLHSHVAHLRRALDATERLRSFDEPPTRLANTVVLRGRLERLAVNEQQGEALYLRTIELAAGPEGRIVMGDDTWLNTGVVIREADRLVALVDSMAGPGRPPNQSGRPRSSI